MRSPFCNHMHDVCSVHFARVLLIINKSQNPSLQSTGSTVPGFWIVEHQLVILNYEKAKF